MESFSNLLSLPLVKMLADKVVEGYSKLKDSNETIKEGLEKAESVLAKTQSALSPVTKELQGPIHVIDHNICKGLSFVESKFPVVKKEPQQVFNAAKDFLSNTVKPAVQRYWSMLTDYESKMKPVTRFVVKQADRVATVVDLMARTAEKVVDYFFAMESKEVKGDGGADEDRSRPAAGPDTETTDVPDAAHPKFVSTAGTVGRVGFKLARAGLLVATSPLRWAYSWKDAVKLNKSSQVREEKEEASETYQLVSGPSTAEPSRSTSPTIEDSKL